MNGVAIAGAVAVMLAGPALCLGDAIAARRSRRRGVAASDIETAYRDARAILAPPGSDGYERLDMRPADRRSEIAELKAMFAGSERSDR